MLFIDILFFWFIWLFFTSALLIIATYLIKPGEKVWGIIYPTWFIISGLIVPYAIVDAVNLITKTLRRG